MASIQNDLRLFGLDLRHVGRDLGRVWRVLQQSPLLSWLTPEPMVRLSHADGQASVWRMGAAPEVQISVPASATPFSAIELPQELFLQRELGLPGLPDDQLASAVALEVQSASPFAAGDLAWGYLACESPGGQSRVTVVIASRQQVDKHLQSSQTGAPSAGASSEVWAFADGVHQPVILQGYGESRRLRYTARRRNAGYGLLALALALLAAIALTPTLQQRSRVIEAMRVHAELERRTAPLVDKRATLMQSIEQFNGLSQELANRIDPLRVVETLTQALPDDTSVQNLKIQGAKVTISGVTADSSALMQLLGAQAGFRDVRAPSAATRTAGAQRESFVVEFSLDPALFNVVTVKPRPAAAPAAASSGDAASSPTASAEPAVPPPQNPQPPSTQPGQPSATFGGGRATFGGGATSNNGAKP